MVWHLLDEQNRGLDDIVYNVVPVWQVEGAVARSIFSTFSSPCFMVISFITTDTEGRPPAPQSTYLYKRWNRVSVSAHSAGAYTATLLMMVNVIKGVGVHPPHSPARANFTLITECTPESSRCNSVYSVSCTLQTRNYCIEYRKKGVSEFGAYSMKKTWGWRK